MFAAVEDINPILGIGGHAGHFHETPAIRQRFPLDERLIAQIPGANLQPSRHSARRHALSISKMDALHVGWSGYPSRPTGDSWETLRPTGMRIEKVIVISVLLTLRL